MTPITGQESSQTKACHTSGLLGWPEQTGRRNPQASYYRARYYDPSTGRFLGEDPITFLGGGNFYRFVSNNPVRFTDSLDLSPEDVEKLKEACQMCTDQLTGTGHRLPSGAGPLGQHELLSWPRIQRQIFAEATDLSVDAQIPKMQGCRQQAENAQLCFQWQGPTTDSKWTFAVVPIWWHLHWVVQGRSSNPSDPAIMCDPWLYRFWTQPANPSAGGKK